jgi:hypothetical protein
MDRPEPIFHFLFSIFHPGKRQPLLDKSPDLKYKNTAQLQQSVLARQKPSERVRTTHRTPTK